MNYKITKLEQTPIENSTSIWIEIMIGTKKYTGIIMPKKDDNNNL